MHKPSNLAKALWDEVKEVIYEVRKNFHPKWKRLWEIYKNGPEPPPVGRKAHMSQRNFIMPTIKIKNGSLTINFPDFWVLSPNISPLMQATIRSWLSFWWRKAKVQPEIRYADLYRWIIGWSAVRVNWEIAINPYAENDEDPAAAIAWEMPTVRFVSPFQFFYDPDIPVPDLQYARWCAEVLYLRKEVVESLPYRDVRNLPATHSGVSWTSAQEPAAMRQRMGKGEYLEIWDIWDKENRLRILCTPADEERVILEEEIENPIFPDVFPYELLTGAIIPDEPFPIGDVELLADPNREINFVRSIILNYAKRSLPQFLYRKGVLTQQGKRAMESGELLQGIEVDYEGPISDAMVPVAPTPLQQHYLLLEQSAREDMNIVSGITDFHRGIPLPTRRQATEVHYIAAMSGIQGQSEQAQFEEFLSRVATKFYHVLRTHCDKALTLPVTTPLGTQIVTVHPQELPEDVLIYISAGSTAFQDRIMERRDLLELLQLLVPLGLPPVGYIPILRRLLSTFNLHPMEIQQVEEALQMLAQQYMQQLLQTQMQQAAQQEGGEEAGVEAGVEEGVEEMPEMEAFGGAV